MVTDSDQAEFSQQIRAVEGPRMQCIQVDIRQAGHADDDRILAIPRAGRKCVNATSTAEEVVGELA